MILRSIIIALILLLNFTDKPGFWEFTGFTVLGFVIYLLTILPGVGLIVVLGCGYMVFNYLHSIQDWHWIPSIIVGIVLSIIMGALFGAGKQNEQEQQMSFPYRIGGMRKN